jgi:hypothetical protein
MKGFLFGVGFFFLYIFILTCAASVSPAVKQEKDWFKECHDKGGEIIYRTTMCIKKEALILP